MTLSFALKRVGVLADIPAGVDRLKRVCRAALFATIRDPVIPGQYEDLHHHLVGELLRCAGAREHPMRRYYPVFAVLC